MKYVRMEHQRKQHRFSEILGFLRFLDFWKKLIG